jgi:hypothetical protein
LPIEKILNIRAGKASPAMLGSNYYGNNTAFAGGKLSVPDAPSSAI